MKGLKNYLSDFIDRAGGFIFFSTVISRLLSFLASWVALQLIPNKELGIVLFSWNIITFLTPLVGLGLHQSYIRYGAMTVSEKEKKALLKYVIKKGSLVSLGITFVVSIFSFFFNFNIEKTGYYLIYFSFIFLPLFLFEILKVKYRLFHQNKKHAFLEIIYNIILVLLITVLSCFLQEMGYIIALITAPTLSILLFIKELKTTKKEYKKPTFINLEFWKYGIFGSLSNVATMLLFAIDILLIGNLLKDAEQITVYKYVSLIPFSMLFLPRVFITTDFVSFTEKIADQKFIKNYIKNYLILFSLISFLFVTISYLFSKQLLSFFDISFIHYTDSFMILSIGICGVLILRGLFGNLLSSIGAIKANFYITAFALIINYIANSKLIPLYGITGAAITSALLMWFTGILSMILFFLKYNKNNTKHL